MLCICHRIRHPPSFVAIAMVCLLLLSISSFVFVIFCILAQASSDALNEPKIHLSPAGDNRQTCTKPAGCFLSPVSSLNFFIIGDIGGLPIYPYYSYAQSKVTNAMIRVARRGLPNFVLNVGDNFYFNGVNSVFDSRFKDSFEEMYDHPELLVPWYTIAGNHDHLGNISAQLAYTDFSNKWTFPELFYKIRILFASEERVLPVVLEILMLDTIVLCGNTVDIQGESLLDWLFAKKRDPNGPPPKYKELAKKQWSWIESQLNTSDADYLLVVGHYPIYSTCEHGGFACLQRLDSLLHAKNVNAYFSGHDHNLQHIRMEKQNPQSAVNYIISGAASRSDRSAKHLNDIPEDALMFRYPTGWNPISQIGFSNGGFVHANLERNRGKIRFYNGMHELKYSFEMKPRKMREDQRNRY